VAAFPVESTLEVAELPLALLELGRMQVDAAQTAAAGDHVMEHLVVNDVGDEVSGHPVSVEPGVDPNEAIDAAVAAELYGLALVLGDRRAACPT
jgi:hypothetical protein